MTASDSLDVLLVLRAVAEQYPPTLNQANILAAKGLKVGMIDLFPGAGGSELHPTVKRWQVHRCWNSKTDQPWSLPTRLKNAFSFRRRFKEVVKWSRPKVVIGYDISGCTYLNPSNHLYRTVFHFHELSSREKGRGWGAALSYSRSLRLSKRADLVVFSDRHRAQHFQEIAGLKNLPQVVMNCPVTQTTIPSSPLKNYVSLDGGPVVCYLGSIGKNQGLVEAARSMQYWPANARLLLIGPYSAAMRAEIEAAASFANSQGRVIFLGPKPHKEALALVAGAALGLALIQQTTKNWLYSAGAVNKRFEYMAMGLPQVTNDSPGVAEIVAATGCGTCVDASSAKSIGLAVADLLADTEKLARFGTNARASHLAQFNYEAQFSKVAAWIDQAVLA